MYLNEISLNEGYKTYLQEWKSVDREIKYHQVEKMGLISEPKHKKEVKIPYRYMCFFKPYIELFTDYLQKNHIEEI